MAAAGLFAGCTELLVERAGVADAEFRFDRRDAGEDILKLVIDDNSIFGRLINFNLR